MDGKDLIQKAWVIEGMALLAYLCFAWALMSPERLAVMATMLPQVALLIGGQGVAASAGPEVKRLIESRDCTARRAGGKKPVGGD